MHREIIISIMVSALIIYGFKLYKVQINSFLLKMFGKVVSWLLKIKSRHQLETLRNAIHAADSDKEKTGRKNMVIFNTTTKKFEPVQKKLLKQVNQVQKKKRLSRTLDPKRIHQIEKKSLYVTK